MSVKAMAAVVAAVTIAIVAARDVRPSEALRASWAGEALRVNDELPPGHPPIERSLPPGHPPIAPRLPEGHPPIPWLEPGCPSGGEPSPDGIERDQGFLHEAPPVIST